MASQLTEVCKIYINTADPQTKYYKENQYYYIRRKDPISRYMEICVCTSMYSKTWL
jgi:hypothetical protein